MIGSGGQKIDEESQKDTWKSRENIIKPFSKLSHFAKETKTLLT